MGFTQVITLGLKTCFNNFRLALIMLMVAFCILNGL
jgi:hypothetical protein